MTIYFDFDGTLVDVRNKYYAVYKAFVAEYQGAALDKKEFWNLKRIKGGDVQILRQSGLANLSTQLFRDYIKEKVETIPFLDRDSLFPGVTGFLKDLSEEHACRLISVRRNETNFQEQVDRLGIRNYFAEIIVASRSDLKTDGYTDKARALLKVIDEEKNMIIGDTEEDIVTGQQLNMTTFAVTSGIRHREYLETLQPDYILSSVIELTRYLS